MVWGDLYEPANTFDATQNISAAYISNEFGFTEKFFYTNTHGVEGWNVVWLWLIVSAICTPISLVKN